MAGPTVAALGPFQFEAHGFGFDTMRDSTKTPWASVPIAGGMNATQFTGGESVEKVIGGVVFPEHFGGQSSLDGIRAAQVAGMVLPLVSLGGGIQNIFGLWFVEGVRVKGTYFNSAGAARMNSYDIHLKAYQGGTGFSLVSVVSLFT